MKAVRTPLCLLLFCLKVLEKTVLKYADLKLEHRAGCINAVLIFEKWKNRTVTSISYLFSFETDQSKMENIVSCYVTYTNAQTHKVILDNLHRSPLYSGRIEGVGPRYCPSIEDKIVRFADKERHQLFC